MRHKLTDEQRKRLAEICDQATANVQKYHAEIDRLVEEAAKVIRLNDTERDILSSDVFIEPVDVDHLLTCLAEYDRPADGFEEMN